MDQNRVQDLNAIWSEVLAQLKLQMTQATYDQWLKNTRLSDRTNGTFQVEVANDFAKDWLENRLYNTIKQSLKDVVGEEPQLEFVVKESLPARTVASETTVDGFTPVFDVVAENLGTMTAVVFGLVWRHCQMERGVCDASTETLANLAGISRRTVIRHLAKLCEVGYLLDLTPNIKHKPHVYKDAGKIKLRQSFEAYIDDQV